MDATRSSLTAGDVMNRDLLVVPRQMLRARGCSPDRPRRAGAAVVVDRAGALCRAAVPGRHLPLDRGWLP